MTESDLDELHTWSMIHSKVGNRQARLTLELIELYGLLVDALQDLYDDHQGPFTEVMDHAEKVLAKARL